MEWTLRFLGNPEGWLPARVTVNVSLPLKSWMAFYSPSWGWERGIWIAADLVLTLNELWINNVRLCLGLTINRLNIILWWSFPPLFFWGSWGCVNGTDVADLFDDWILSIWSPQTKWVKQILKLIRDGQLVTQHDSLRERRVLYLLSRDAFGNAVVIRPIDTWYLHT